MVSPCTRFYLGGLVDRDIGTPRTARSSRRLKLTRHHQTGEITQADVDLVKQGYRWMSISATVRRNHLYSLFRGPRAICLTQWNRSVLSHAA